MGFLVDELEKTKRLVMGKEHIGFFKAILESYEDIGLFSVLDGKRGIIELVYPVHFEEDIRAIVDGMGLHGVVFREVDDV